VITIEQILEVQSNSIQEVLKSPELTRLVLIIYVDLWGCKYPKFCTRSITEYYEAIKSQGKTKFNQKNMERKYILKEGTQIWSGLHQTFYNSMTITDEIAEQLIKLSPRLKNQFKKTPLPEVLQPENAKVKATVIRVKKPTKK
jgi:hypothetical protein